MFVWSALILAFFGPLLPSIAGINDRYDFFALNLLKSNLDNDTVKDLWSENRIIKININ